MPTQKREAKAPAINLSSELAQCEAVMKLMVAHKMHVVKLPSGLELQAAASAFAAPMVQSPRRPPEDEDEVPPDIRAPWEMFRNSQAVAQAAAPVAQTPNREQDALRANILRAAKEAMARAHNPLDPDRTLDEAEVSESRIPEDHGIPEAYSDG